MIYVSSDLLALYMISDFHMVLLNIMYVLLLLHREVGKAIGYLGLFTQVDDKLDRPRPLDSCNPLS